MITQPGRREYRISVLAKARGPHYHLRDTGDTGSPETSLIAIIGHKQHNRSICAFRNPVRSRRATGHALTSCLLGLYIVVVMAVRASRNVGCWVRAVL